MKPLPTCLTGYIIICLLQVLKNSDVEIPCTFTAPVNHSEVVHIIWYTYRATSYPQVYNNKDSSQVLIEYEGRTSLVPNGTDSCTLRIRDVTKTATFYPGISDKINSFDLNHGQSVQVKVTGCYEDNSCNDWSFHFPAAIDAVRGSCVEIPCTFTHPEGAKDFNFFWYLYKRVGSKPQIFNNKTPDDVIAEYRGRTFLPGNMKNDCSLRINNVTEWENYYPGINSDINSVDLQKTKSFAPTTISIRALDEPPKPSISGVGDLEEGKSVTITCAISHTCASSPPTITWNIPGHLTTERSKAGYKGKLHMESIMMSYTPHYTDHNTTVTCSAVFPNKKTSAENVLLNIKYRPKNTTISVVGNKQTEDGEEEVTLRCLALANPPVTQYSWYKIGQERQLLEEHGDTITVKNVTTEKYVCTVANLIGSGSSAMFQFTEQPDNKDTLLNIIIGVAVGLVILTGLIIIFYLFKRRKTKTTLFEETRVEQTEQEHIAMDHLYGNVDPSHRNEMREKSSRPPESYPIYDNTNVEQSKIKENQTEKSDGIVYTQVEFPSMGQVVQQSKSSEEIEYAIVIH
ncbi:sialic acid-binding Ig-like lectin 6 isoform X2 [Hyperolius riggenbachi]|uniref:sialic acid-binding Ig-like lectin 6 isoform X2 n=1 Tax=Hyperolius riggenbachi TaxID=752182 RepID=UPI0035A3C87C